MVLAWKSIRSASCMVAGFWPINHSFVLLWKQPFMSYSWNLSISLHNRYDQLLKYILNFLLTQYVHLEKLHLMEIGQFPTLLLIYLSILLTYCRMRSNKLYCMLLGWSGGVVAFPTFSEQIHEGLSSLY